MPFVTTLTFQSGDRHTLERVVNDVKESAARKGAEFRGPHAESPVNYRVPQRKRVDRTDEFDPWTYTVYERRLEIVGYDEFASEITTKKLPMAIYLDITIERVSTPGSS